MRIRIVKVPSGQAPDWVRQEWIGVELSVVVPKGPGLFLGARGGHHDSRNVNGHVVTLADALTALRVKSPKAAEWWDDCLGPHRERMLVFAREVCEVIV